MTEADLTWYPCSCGAEHDTPLCPFGAGVTEAAYRALEAERDMLLAALKQAERLCPCGARPEAPHTHPHVGGCPIGDAIAKVGTP